MNAIQALAADLSARLPAAAVKIDDPGTETGVWFLDATLAGQCVTVEWADGEEHFGVSVGTPAGGYGDGPDALIRFDDAAEYVAGLLKLEQICR